MSKKMKKYTFFNMSSNSLICEVKFVDDPLRLLIFFKFCKHHYQFHKK